MKKWFMMGIILAAFLASVGIVSAGAVSENLVSNGGFETPVSIGNWQLFPQGNEGSGWYVESTGKGTESGTLQIRNQSTAILNAFEGSQYAQLSPRAPGQEESTVTLSQAVPQVKGNTYRISFVQSCRPDDPAPSNLAVFWGDEQLDHTSCPSGHAASWVSRSYTVTAPSNESVQLRFVNEGSGDSYGTLLDDVSVKTVNDTMPVPEFPIGVVPAFLFGFIGFIHILRKDH